MKRSKKCIPCIGAKIKEAILKEVIVPEVAEILKSIEDCNRPFDIQVCAIGGKKRAPSAYNLFVKDCMKSRPQSTPVTEYMRVCAEEYRRRKQ